MKQIFLAPFQKEFWQELGQQFMGQETPTGSKVSNKLKIAIVAILISNFFIHYFFGDFVVSAFIVAEFIAALTLSSKIYPLLSGGLLFMQFLFMGLLPGEVYWLEIEHNIALTLLLVFVVTGVDFLQKLLMTIFSGLIMGIKNLTSLCITFSVFAAVFSANMDALTVTAVMMTITTSMLAAIMIIIEVKKAGYISDTEEEQFRAFLYGLMMSGLIGTMLGGMLTMIGEPQNYDIAKKNGWGMSEFFFRMIPIGAPVFIVGICALGWSVKKKKFGYGVEMPTRIRTSLEEHFNFEKAKMTMKEKFPIFVQMVVLFFFVYQLFSHQYELAVVGLFLIILIAVFTGINSEHTIAHKFVEAMGFVAVLMTFYGLVALINHHQVFTGVVEVIMEIEDQRFKAVAISAAAGAKSILSDNVLVELIWMTELDKLLLSSSITPWEHDYYSIALNAGTNVPSILTPNGSAPFLFFFLSSLAIKELRVTYV